MNNGFVFINNQFVKAAEAAIGISDLALLRGYGIFDFLKVVQNKPLFLEDHLNRFYASAAFLRLPVGHTKKELSDLLYTLIHKNNLPYSGLRLTLTGGYSPDGYLPATPNLLIGQQPLPPPSPLLFEKGIHLISHAYQRQLPQVKSIDYLMAVWLQPLLQQQGADDVLYHRDGMVSECPRANIFMVTPNQELVTPASLVLKGITRMKVMALAQPDFTVTERDITVAELRQATEVFITSTTKQILPVVQLDGAPIGNGKPGPVTRRLHQALAALLLKEESNSHL